MSIYSVALFFVIAFVATRALSRSVGEGAASSNRFYTLILDPLMFLAAGFVTTIVGLWTRGGKKRSYEEFKSRKRVLDTVLILFLLAFWGFETLTYFDVTVLGYHLGHPFNPLKTGNDFMWNGYLDFFFGPLVDTSTPTYESPLMNVLAFGLLLAQYAALWLGMKLGYMTAFFNDLSRWTKPKK